VVEVTDSLCGLAWALKIWMKQRRYHPAASLWLMGKLHPDIRPC